MEVKVISNGSALVSEEKGPSLVSEYASLAPEEVGGKSKGQFKIKAERTTEEIKRDRRQIKQKIKGHGSLAYAYPQSVAVDAMISGFQGPRIPKISAFTLVQTAVNSYESGIGFRTK